MTIREQFLYGLIQFDTYSQSSGTWTDRTSSLNSLMYSEGGRLTTPGANTVDVGTLNASFKDLATVPVVGDFVRLRRYGTTEYAFTGYVQDIGQRIVYDNTTKLSTPLTITTLYCLDWVGYMAQWIVSGVSGRNSSFALFSSGGYNDPDRIRAINYSFDNSNATQIISATPDAGTVGAIRLSDTDLVASASDHLDLLSRTTGMIWYGSHVVPTNNTTGRTGLIKWLYAGGSVSSGKTFTDLVGSAGQLHYTEIDLESSSQNVANKIAINNTSLVSTDDPDYTQIAGGNDNNFIYVDLTTKRLGTTAQTTWVAQDDTSIANYGARQTQFETNIFTPVDSYIGSSPSFVGTAGNLIANGSVEYTDSGWGLGSNNRVRRREPGADAPNGYGDWAIRLKHTAAAAGQSSADYSGGESDGIPVSNSRYYRVSAWCARGAISRTDLRATMRINWYDDEEALISSASGSAVSLTTASSWYQVDHFAQAPATATRATITIRFQRSGGGNLTRGDIAWIDGLCMANCNSAGSPTINYFDGDTSKNSGGFTIWTGEVGNSQSLLLQNPLVTRADQLVAQYNTTGIRATRIRWNAQEDLTAVSAMTVGKTISLIYKSTTTTYRIIGIDGTVDPGRYMIDYYLVKA